MTRDDSGSPPWDVQLIHENVRKWFQTGRSQGAKYLLICQDTFDIYDPDLGLYPHYSDTGDEARRFSTAQLTGIDVLVEVLDLAQDLDVQLSRPRKKNLDDLD